MQEAEAWFPSQITGAKRKPPFDQQFHSRCWWINYVAASREGKVWVGLRFLFCSLWFLFVWFEEHWLVRWAGYLRWHSQSSPFLLNSKEFLIWNNSCQITVSCYHWAALSLSIMSTDGCREESLLEGEWMNSHIPLVIFQNGHPTDQSCKQDCLPIRLWWLGAMWNFTARSTVMPNLISSGWNTWKSTAASMDLMGHPMSQCWRLVLAPSVYSQGIPSSALVSVLERPATLWGYFSEKPAVSWQKTLALSKGSCHQWKP